MTGSVLKIIGFIVQRTLLINCTLQAAVIRHLTDSMEVRLPAVPKRAMSIYIMVSKRLCIFIPYIAISGGCLTMRRDEAAAILNPSLPFLAPIYNNNSKL